MTSTIVPGCPDPIHPTCQALCWGRTGFELQGPGCLTWGLVQFPGVCQGPRGPKVIPVGSVAGKSQLGSHRRPRVDMKIMTTDCFSDGSRRRSQQDINGTPGACCGSS